ncbi:MAG: NGG1p interacting factor NIF3 [Candidatus Omnitrophica bacterium]|nr:NGG1p interacting factor NIF3 [Candidatus Omnitrophota bacterium]
MKLAELFAAIVSCGIDRDVRGKGRRIDYFPDSALLYGDPHTDIKHIMVGIDIETPELLLADRLRSSQGIDLVIAHHPEGRAYARLHEAMQLQVDILVKAGFPQSAAESYLTERMREVSRRLSPQNHMRSVDTAKLLDMPFICAHTPADNHVYWFLTDLMRAKKPRRVKDIFDILHKIPEYAQASSINQGPQLILGSLHREAGKIFVEMTGGTEGHRDIYPTLYKTGVRTLVCMHLSEEHFKKVNDANLNVIIAGHVSSDTLGVNLLLDRVERLAREKFHFIDCSGFRRIRRN